LVTNRTVFAKVPDSVIAYRVNPSLRREDGSLFDARRDWAFNEVSPHRVLAFHAPPDSLASWLRTEFAQNYDHRRRDEIEGIATHNIVVRLLRGCIETKLRERGCEWSATTEAFTLPGKHGATIRVQLPDGKRTTVQHSGERTYFRVGLPKQKYRYRMAVRLITDRFGDDAFGLVWALRFHLTDLNDEPLHSTQRLSRRKHLTRTWHNYHWLVRHLAAMQFCADENGQIRVGPKGEGEVVLDCGATPLQVPVGIDESQLALEPEASEEEADAEPVTEDFEHVHDNDQEEHDDE
jgi:hypothetical protein